MAVKTRIATHYLRTQALWTVICLVLGLWGVYDYAITIPNRILEHEQYKALSAATTAFDPDADDTEIKGAADSLSDALDRIIASAATSAGLDIQHDSRDFSWFTGLLVLTSESNVTPPDTEDGRRIQALADAILASPSRDWFTNASLTRIAVMSRQPGTPLSDNQLAAYDRIESLLNDLGTPKAVSKFDRFTQWIYIACLPFVPLFLWNIFSATRKHYELHDDGSVTVLGDHWAADDIADIDMSRWMSKSIAVLKHRDGRSVELDDYKHRDLDKIVGAIAAARHPDQWTPEAKPVKAADADAKPDDAPPAAADQTDPAPDTDPDSKA